MSVGGVVTDPVDVGQQQAWTPSTVDLTFQKPVLALPGDPANLWSLTGGSSLAGHLTGAGAIANGAQAGGRAPYHGDQFIEGDANSPNGFTIAFDTAMSAFGFYGIDIGDFTGGGSAGVLEVIFTLGGAQVDVDPNQVGVQSYILDGGTSPKFWGFTNSTGLAFFDAVTFKNNTRGSTSNVDGQGFDMFMVASSKVDTNGGGGGDVPEPGVLVLLSTALLGLGLTRKRQS